jgi:hypothetical protein
MREWFMIISLVVCSMALGILLSECNQTVRVERVVVRDTIVVRDTVRITIPERVVNSRVHARKVNRSSTVSYRADTTLGDGVTMQIEFVPDSMVFNVALRVPARDTVLPRVITIERAIGTPQNTRQSVGTGIMHAFLYGVLIGAGVILLVLR